ncbi:MAG: hypothetical protein HYS26_01690 [Candidatus Kaiserbacteria bacterium]|nr:MAG: hypothetical protein HYS26_01690 [Candidatus Kaiserbacteria bacterium]
MSVDNTGRHRFEEDLPASEMVYPSALSHRLKYLVWRVYTPYHAYCRDALYSLKTVRKIKANRVGQRQRYLLGHIAPSSHVGALVEHLVANGYRQQEVAWKDEGEIVNLRLLQDFVYQYHIRIFEDGEVRAHYEFTPECYPLRHLRQKGQTHEREYFLDLLRDHITPSEEWERD